MRKLLRLRPAPELPVRKHRWRAIATFTVDDSTARALASPAGQTVPLLLADRESVGVGCIDCEGAFTVVFNRNCPGKP